MSILQIYVIVNGRIGVLAKSQPALWEDTKRAMGQRKKVDPAMMTHGRGQRTLDFLSSESSGGTIALSGCAYFRAVDPARTD